MKKLSFSTPRREFLTLVAAALLAGCKPSGGSGGDASAGGSAGGAGTIVVGEFASLTGTEATFGKSSHEGTLLAIEELNKAGGLFGKQFSLITEDNRSTAGESVTIVKKFISRDHVVAVLGEVASGRSMEAAPVCQAAGIPMVSPSSTNPKVTEIGDYIFRVCFIDPFQGKLLADFASKTLKAKKVALLSDVSSAYSDGLGRFFREGFTATGGEIVSEQKYTSKDKDFKAQLTAIKAASPDAIFVPGYYTEAGLIVAQARQLGITMPIFGGDGWEAPELIQIAGGDALANTYYSTHYSPESSDVRVQEFVKAFRARFNDETPDAMAALGYDSAMVLADAMKRAGTTDGAKVRDALAATKDYPCVTGKTTLDSARNASKAAVIITVKDGKFKYLETIQP
ncbi:MAG TPA: ABC transporter substrate-binding protein [Candidatus Limnocylindria bacterium]|nr:ABC transporter substrate-binding protein [Candidatus Limnocylindria bacterium]